jgi:pre-mRNA-splicing factor SYF1
MNLFHFSRRLRKTQRIYVEYLISIDWLEEAAQQLAKIVKDYRFVSKYGKSNHQLWNELWEMISQNPDKIT